MTSPIIDYDIWRRDIILAPALISHGAGATQCGDVVDSVDSQSTGLQRERYLWLAVSLKRVTALLQAAAMVLLLLLLLSPDCGKGCGSAVGHSSHPTIVSTSLCWAHLTSPRHCAVLYRCRVRALGFTSLVPEQSRGCVPNTRTLHTRQLYI